MITNTELAMRLLFAAFLGGLIGLERERHKKLAGLRTHVLVCIGSTLITLTSLYAFTSAADPSRVAAGIITGIGFLGAGTIMHAKKAVYGLTTAASLWVAASIGLAVGAGFYLGAIITTALVLVFLIFKQIDKLA